MDTSLDVQSTMDIVLPELLAAVLRQNSMSNASYVFHVSHAMPVWLLRDNDIEDSTPFLNWFLSLPHSIRTKVVALSVLIYSCLTFDDQTEENALIAKLSLYAVYRRLHSDMFLSSLTESSMFEPPCPHSARLNPHFQRSPCRWGCPVNLNTYHPRQYMIYWQHWTRLGGYIGQIFYSLLNGEVF